jgi:hypothetical protein
MFICYLLFIVVIFDCPHTGSDMGGWRVAAGRRIPAQVDRWRPGQVLRVNAAIITRTE